MAGIKNFKKKERTYRDAKNVTKSEYQSESKKKLTKSEQFWENAYQWVAYYKSNIHRLAIDAGVQLKDFQKILMYMMDKYPIFMWIASRGTGKSFLIMLYCLCRAILYPKSQIVISSGTKGQAILLISQYGKFFYNEYPFFRNEIQEISTNKQEPKIILYNGSTIYAVTASDNSRGYRSTLLILEEFRMIKKEILDSVLRKFGTTPRQPPYIHKPEYKNKDSVESIKEIYISSAWFASHWSFEKMKSFWKKMREEDNRRYAVMSSDIELPIYEGLYDEEKLMEEKSELDNDPITWSMEMDSLWFGEGKSDIIRYSDFEKNRKIKKCVYPHDHASFIGVKNKPKPRKYKNGNFGVLSVDIAVSSKKDSDNTIFKYWEVSEVSSGYMRELKYIESMNGKNHNDIDLRIKQLWYDFGISYIAMDAQTIGLAVLDELGSKTYDELRDMEYQAFKSFSDEDYAERALDKNAIPNLFTINASQNLNDLMIRDISAVLKSGKIRFLINENEFRDIKVQQDDKYMLLSAEERVKQELPYVQTNLMVNESINLEIEVVNGKIKVKEVGRNRKDRFSALIYGNWLISQLEHEMLKSRQSSDESNVWVDVY